jgi:hypothetical protein
MFSLMKSKVLTILLGTLNLLGAAPKSFIAEFGMPSRQQLLSLVMSLPQQNLCVDSGSGRRPNS